MPTKELLNAIHDVVRWVGHVILVPIVAVLKGITALTTHLTIELEKI